MSFTKTYFLCPTSDFILPPPEGPLQLGSIVHSTSAPQYPLNKASVVDVPNAIPPIVEKDWRKTVSAEDGLGLGVYAHFSRLATGGVPIGPEGNLERTKKTANTFAFDTVTTIAFEPTREYVEEAVKAPAVQAWLKEPRHKFARGRELFVVTGMKIVKGARMKYSSSQNTKVRANVGIDVPTLGVTLGPKGSWTSTNDDTTESTRESEFVFAFRVKRLRFGRRLKLEEYNKGAFMSIGGKEDDEECIVVEDVDGAEIKTAEAVPDVTENGNVYCVPA